MFTYIGQQAFSSTSVTFDEKISLQEMNLHQFNS